MIPSAEFTFTSLDGLRIACVRWDSIGHMRGVMQIANGMGEHIGRYAETIDALNRAGLTVYGNDHRGHGRTAPSPKDFGDFGAGGFDFLVKDMVRLGCIARQEHPRAPFFLLGHSLGSFAAQQYVLDHGREIEGLQALIERYREAGLTDISYDFYAGGRHEMLNEINRDEVRARLLRWISAALKRSKAGLKTSSTVH